MYAQPPQSGPKPELVVKGTIVDELTSKPVEYATISLKSMRDSTLLLGALADEKGNFTIDVPRPGRYIMKISFIGYQTKTDSITITPNAPVVQLRTVRIKPATQTLDDITVKGERETFENSIDKKVFNVEKNALVAGGSGTDVLKQIPIINFDQDNNIQLRGTTNVTVWINGRPSGMTGMSKQAVLDNIPASSIERVEVITNPSARYDAEGMGGIINIVLKKNRTDGINGSVIIGTGTRDAYNRSATKYNDLNKYNGALSLNAKLGKWNISTNFGYRYNHAWHVIDNIRLNKTAGGTNDYYLNQYTTGDSLVRQNFNGGATVEYAINDKNTIGVSSFATYNTGNDPELIRTDWKTADNNLYQQRFRTLSNTSQGYTLDQNLFYRKTFNKPGQELNVSSAYTYGYNDNDSRFRQRDIVSGIQNTGFVSRTGLVGIGVNQNGVFQADYVHPISEFTKFETGVKATFRRFDNQLIADSIGPNALTVTDQTKTNQFVLDEYVYAAYGMVNQNFKIFAAQLGLRYEYTQIAGDLKEHVDPFSLQKIDRQINSRGYGNLFPSFYLSKKLPGEQEIRVGYSLRINRPGSDQLNPFPTWNNPLDLRYGNPYINPELTHSAEATYSKNWKNHNLTATLYYRHTENSIQRFRVITPEGVAIMQFRNANYTQNYGGEFIMRNQWVKIWSTTATVNLFQSVVKGLEINNQMPSANFRLQSQLRVWKNMDIQLNGSYMLPMAILQGTFQGFNGVDIGFRKEMLKGKGSLAVNLSDVFNTRYMTVQFNNAQQFSGYMFRQRESRVLTVTFTYKFGSENLSFNRNKRRSEQPQQGGMDMGGY